MAFTRRETAILIVGDFLILVASLWVALALRNLAFPAPGYFEANLVPFLPVFLLSLVIFYIAGLYEKQTRLVHYAMGERILGAQVANVCIAAVLFFALPLTIAPKTILALYLIVSFVAVSSWRFYRTGRARSPAARSPAVLVGTGAAVQEAFEEVNANPHALMHFSAFLDTATHADTLAAGLRAALASGAAIVVLDTRDTAVARILPELYGAVAHGVTFIEFSEFYEDTFDRVPLAHVDHAWLLEYVPREHLAHDIARRGADILLAVFGLVIAAPFILVAAILLRLSGGPAFIASERVGKGGRICTIWKLRTMLFNDAGDPALRAKNRVTRLGKFLRKTRIDELPQLWNVLVGDLSLVGPRPELPALAAVYEREIPYYQTRHLITPGLSGWAQIHDYDAPRGGVDIERTRRKLSYDLYYLAHRSLGLDAAIALKTLRALASLSGT
ncbi:MAG TPA: sugar transferase [Candidatus Paceibacterota bacterium]|nr:sugar transferase [Candidatus Paceibacterota bacterium]